MSTVPQKLSEPNSQAFASMDHQRSQSATNPQMADEVTAWTANAMAIPSAIALAISAYLAFATFTMSDVAGCGSGAVFDCGHVLYSKWSKAVGVPVSVFAFITHASLIAGLFVALSKRSGTTMRKLAAKVVFVAALASLFAALYFISLQVFVLKHLCSYCMGAHVCGLIVGILAIWKLPVAPGLKRKLAGIGFAGIAALASIQFASAEPQTYKIDTFAPASDGQTDQLEPAANDANSEEAGDIFSAPGESESADDPDIFSAPVETGASNLLPRGRLIGLSANNLALLHLLSGNRFALASNSLLIAVPRQQESSAKQQESAGQTQGSAGKVPEDTAKATTKAQPTESSNETSAPAKSARLVPMLGGSVKLKAIDWPLIGNPDAKHVFVEMFDYTCEHCRATNNAIEVAKKKLGSDLAVVVLPVPMNTNCNPTINTTSPAHAESCELSRLAIAVWRVDPDKLGEFHQWMFAGETSPNYSAALAKAKEMVGVDELNAELAKSVCSQYVDRNVQLYKRVGGGPIPKMIFKQTTIVGEFTSGDSLTNLIKEYTAVK